MINLLRANSRCKSVVHETTPAIINDCNYKFRFSDDVRSNLLCSLKMTPIWLVLCVMRHELKKLISSEWETTVASENPAAVDVPFFPTGPEYQYLCTSFDLDAIPFNTVKIQS